MLRRAAIAMAIVCGVWLSVFSGMRLFADSSGAAVAPAISAKLFPNQQEYQNWKRRSYSKTRWWGDFPPNLPRPKHMFKKYPWAVGPFTKYAGNPVLAPTPGAWDKGTLNAGVHNGSILYRHGRFYYIFRGSRPWSDPLGWICDIGIATSRNGTHFTLVTRHSGLFRHGKYKKYSYEDVCVVQSHGKYYLFCNQWYPSNMDNHRVNGVFLAVSKDLIHWKRVGIVFPHAQRVYRNATIVQTPHNRAVKIHGRYVMYLDNGLMAYSTDMVHWTPAQRPVKFPGGEVCFALANQWPRHPNRIVLFTGGHHTGHYYAIGEVLFSKADPHRMLAYLPRPVLAENPKIPYEDGFSATDPDKFISDYSDTTFFTGMTRHAGKWWLYYGGSEYYTCLATAAAR